MNIPRSPANNGYAHHQLDQLHGRSVERKGGIQNIPPSNQETIMFKCENEKIVLLMNWLQDRDRDGRISYAEFCGKKTINEKAFEVTCNQLPPDGIFKWN